MTGFFKAFIIGKKWKNLDYQTKMMKKTALKCLKVMSVLADYPEIFK